MSKLSEGIE